MRNLRTITGTPGARDALTAVALALFGLLVMHGSGIHAHSTGATPDGENALVTSPHAGPHGHAERAATEAASGYAAGGVPEGGDLRATEPAGDQGTGVLGFCLAALAGVLVGVTLLRRRRGARIPRTLLPAWTHAVVEGGDRDPPEPLRLCVIRC